MKHSRDSGLWDVVALVLAAGGSSRMGSPKALLEIDGRPVLQRIVDVLRDVRVGSGCIVLGEQAEEIAGRITPTPFAFVANPDPDQGRMSSIRVGLEAVGLDRDVVLWPVDRPLARRPTVQALLEARVLASANERVIAPVSSGRGGHPIVLSRTILPDLTRAKPNENLRDVLRAASPSRRDVFVDDPRIHTNLDTPDDYARAIQDASN